MPGIHDSQRPIAYGKPCWLGTTQPLPQLVIVPASPWKWTLGLWLYDPSIRGALWWSIECTAMRVTGVLEFWERDPESALQSVFGASVPQPLATSYTPPDVMASATADEMGL